jgi:hypothetical protein
MTWLRFLMTFVARWAVRASGSAPALPSPPSALAPLGVEEGAVLVSLSRCVGCGACDAAFDAYGKVVRSELRGPSELALSYARSLRDVDATAGWLVHLEKGDLARLERACPVDVPFARLAAVLKKRAGTPRVRETKVARKRHDPG